MRKTCIILSGMVGLLKLNVFVIGFIAIATNASAVTRYVWQTSPDPAPPFTTWTTAAHVIQDAVDAADPGDEVVVTDGIYATGSRIVETNPLASRVAVTNPITLRSVNGPKSTIIEGHQIAGTTNGDGAIRCVYLGSGASLSGFTLTNGATRISSHTMSANDSNGGGAWCGADVLVTDCLITGNSADFSGGGVIGGTLIACTLVGNTAYWGGGASLASLKSCALNGNSAFWGGGAFGSTLTECQVVTNSASRGGAASGYDRPCTLVNCSLSGNSADSGGAVAYGALSNCTLVANSATSFAGGVSDSDLYNCIVYYNTAPDAGNYNSSSKLNYCCTTPVPAAGSGNTSLEPQLADLSHIAAASPCRGAGDARGVTGKDIDGEDWANPPSIGCDEYNPVAMTGPLLVSIVTGFTNVATGYTLGLTALIDGRATASRWEFGDGTQVSNWLYATHFWAAPGDYTVVLHAYNNNHPEGVSAAVVIRVEQVVHYVSAGNPNPLAPYTTWATAATSIQDAVDAAMLPGALVLVTNGLYAAGGGPSPDSVTNRVMLHKPLILRSVNGPAVTLIRGAETVRGVYVGLNSVLDGFQVTSGHAITGGGVSCASSSLVTNCIIIGNSADSGGGVAGGVVCRSLVANNTVTNHGGGVLGSLVRDSTLTGNATIGLSGGAGGGAFQCTLYNCLITSNSASVRIGLGGSGGGACYSTLHECILIGNGARFGGRVEGGTLYNCTVVFNSASYGGGTAYASVSNSIVYYNYYGDNYSSAVDHSCTTPVGDEAMRNISAEPAFVDLAHGNLRLQPNSPCINSGNNAIVSDVSDSDGNPRIVSGTVDIGAYEYQGAGSVISYAWLQQYGLPTDGSVDYLDLDQDGRTTWEEWRCLTDPTNALSVLRLLSPSSDGTNVTVTWQSVPGRTYFLERSTNLTAWPSFSLLATNVVADTNTMSFQDTNAASFAPLFYRIGVGN